MTALTTEHAGLLENIPELEKALEAKRSRKKAEMVTSIDELEIEVTTTNDVRVCDQWIRDFRESKLKWIGLDIEWKANTIKGQVPNPIATLQLGTRDKALILQLLHFQTGFSKALKKLLADETVTKIGVGIGEDCRKLEQQGLVCKGAIDLSKFYLSCQKLFCRNGCWSCVLARRPDGKPMEKYVWGKWPYVKERAVGLKRLAKLVLGIDFQKPKNFWRWDWSKRKLPKHMREYAARDAVLAIRAFERIYALPDHQAHLLIHET